MKEHYAGNMTSPEFREAIKSNRGVIITIGSCEQHGHHLPLDTDNLIGFNTAINVAKRTDCLLLPPINYGQVWSAKNFSGTIALTTTTIKAILHDIVISLQRHGVKNIIFMSGHNGNCAAIKEACREIHDQYGWNNVWHVFPTLSKEGWELLESPIACNCIHAGELETSMVLAIRPDLVHMDCVTKEYPVQPKELAYRPMGWDEYIETGSFGDSSLASIEKGQRINQLMIDEAVRIISEVIH